MQIFFKVGNSVSFPLTGKGTKLSYSQIKLLAHIFRRGSLQCLSWDVKFKDIQELYNYYSIYTDCKTLENNTLIIQNNKEKGIMMGMGNMILSPLGFKFTKLVDLSMYVEPETDSLTSEIDAIYAIIQRFSQTSR